MKMVLIMTATILLTLTTCSKTDENNISRNEPINIPQIEATDIGNILDNDSSYGEITNENVSEENSMISISITVGNSVLPAKLYDNDTTRTLLTMFPMTLNMSELNGNEKYYNLSDTLPTASERVGSVNAGDLMLFGSDCLVLFYESFSTSYSYTRLGFIEDTSGLADILGRDSVDVTFAIAD